jgi:CRISPR-associated protein Cas2
MTVIVANETPPAIRGLLKRWFIEPRPNVFVGSVNRRTREKTLAYIRRNAPGLGMLIIAAERSSQGYSIECVGDTQRRPARLSGLQLIAEAWNESDEGPPERTMC